MQKEIKQYNPDKKEGLTSKQIEERIADNLINYDTSVPTKSVKAIIFSNVFTLFNFINLILALAVLWVGSYKNLLFIAIIIINTLISTIQEIHSKKIVDKLSLLANKKVKGIRDGRQQEIDVNDIVLEDVLLFQAGDQIPTDCVILEGEVEVDESCITGEADAISKTEMGKLLSGSFISSGKCIAKVEHIGKDNYVAKISNEVKNIRKVNSEIMRSLNKIIGIVSIAIIPVGILLFWNQSGIDGNSFQNAVVSTVAALIGMIPEGLVLLTSTVLAVSVIRLSKQKVLVQELYCIETLARVDTLCLDKTGTITEGKMEVKKCIPIASTQEELETALAALGQYSEDNNATIEAIREKYIQKIEWKVKQKVAFQSAKKWSGISFEKQGTYILGAPEFVLQEQYENYREEIEKYTRRL